MDLQAAHFTTLRLLHTDCQGHIIVSSPLKTAIPDLAFEESKTMTDR